MEEKMQALARENEQLKKDNAALMNTIIQMKTTLNRLVNRYMTGAAALSEKEKDGEQA